MNVCIDISTGHGYRSRSKVMNCVQVPHQFSLPLPYNSLLLHDFLFSTVTGIHRHMFLFLLRMLHLDLVTYERRDFRIETGNFNSRAISCQLCIPWQSVFLAQNFRFKIVLMLMAPVFGTETKNVKGIITNRSESRAVACVLEPCTHLKCFILFLRF